ncbi:MAG: HAD family hydrolase [Anaerolineaceae bacterium]|nr:HAD family hydrolase [Anaerolineaceae bacterium]
MIKAVFFDLDGTLLPLDQELLIENYFMLLAKKLASFGYEPNTLIKAIKHAAEAMKKNNGLRTNEAVFWEDYTHSIGDQARTHKSLFTDFYKHEFQKLKEICGYNYKMARIVKAVREKGLQVALATNPVFPAIAQESRMRWAGLEPEDFDFYTSYENIGFTKPNLGYYRELARRAKVAASECLMIGNDVEDDMVADQLGMRVFLLTDCLINNKGDDLSEFPHGDLAEMQSFLSKI